MAAKTIKGITVEIGGSTTKLNEALKSAETPARNLQSSLKAVNQALKLDPTNTELLAEKQKILASYINVTREKLETLKGVQDQIRQQYANGDIDQGAYLDFQKELEYTKSKLEDLEKQQKEFGSVVTQVMQEAGTKVSEFGNKVSGAGEKLMPVTGVIVAAGAAAVSAGSDILESQNKVEVAFGNSADRIKEFADTTLDTYGIAKGTALDMAALFGDMATSMEIPQDAAAQMSETLVGLSGDLASFKNLDLETAQNALKGIFTGETESLKNLGVVMTQNNLLQFAMQQGLIDTAKSAQQLEKEQIALEKAQVSYNSAVSKYGASSLEAREAALKVADAEATLNEKAKGSLDTLTTAEMVQLRYAYVLNATKNAQGDFANTSDGAANSMRVASEAAKEVAADFGTLLAPYAAQAAQMVSDLLKQFIAMPEGQKEVILLVAAMVAGLGPLLIVGGKVITGAGTVISLLGKFPALLTAAKTGFSAVSGVMSGALTGAIQGVSTAFSFLAANPIVAVIAIIATLTAAFVTAYNKCEWFRDGVNNAITNVKEWWASSIERIKGLFDFEWNWPKLKLPHFSITGSFSLDPPSIPKIGVQWYAKGGILNGAQIFGSIGNTLLGGGEAGPEAVLPLASFYDNLRSILSQFVGSRGAASGLLVQVNIEHFENSGEQDVDELAEQVADRIQFHVAQKEASLT